MTDKVYLFVAGICMGILLALTTIAVLVYVVRGY